MRLTKTFLFAFLVAFNAALAQETTRRSALEFPRTEVVPITDTQNNRAYELYVRLPESYTENTDRQHPVIYYTDAMWHVETLSGSADYIMEDAILVGISWQVDIDEELKKEVGAHVSRYRDYSFLEHSNPEYQTKYHFGQADKHLAFIRDTVIPFVESNYRTRPDQRSYFGYSMSGEFGAYIMLSQPGTFKNYILGSPSIRSNDIAELSEIAANQTNLDANVFISYGSLEDRLGKSAEEFIAMLKAKNDQSLRLNPVVIEGSHQTAFPMTTVRGVTWISEMNRLPTMIGPYFGQGLPGTTAEIFAPEIVSVDGRYEYAVSFSPDMGEIYFSGNKEGQAQLTYRSKRFNNKWTEPERVDFTKGKKTNEFEAFVTGSNDKIYFAADGPEDVKIWYANRSGDAWSEATELMSPVNDDKVFYPNVAKNGDLYYFNISKRKMYYAPYKRGKYPRAYEVGIAFGAHGFISPEQDFMLVDAWKENDRTKDKDIHVCFRKKDGSWTDPINLGIGVNSDFTETCPSLTPDGKYLFFSRYNEEGGLSNIYWVSADVIDQVRPEDL